MGGAGRARGLLPPLGCPLNEPPDHVRAVRQVRLFLPQIVKQPEVLRGELDLENGRRGRCIGGLLHHAGQYGISCPLTQYLLDNNYRSDDIYGCGIRASGMNGFEKHKISHLSASSVNLFAAEPALWIMERLLKRRGPVGCAAHRGTAAEAGIVMGLLDPKAEVAACQAHAVAEFDRLAALSGDPRRTKEREAVPGIVATGIRELRGYGIPDVIQGKVERELPGVPVPFIGYIDLHWSAHAITLDIKSSLRLSSEISTSHARQVGLYLHGTNHEGRVAYCTPQKVGVYRLENAAEHVAALANIAQRMERFLSLSDDPQFLASIVCPNTDSFYWSDPTTRALAREVFAL